MEGWDIWVLMVCRKTSCNSCRYANSHYCGHSHFAEKYFPLRKYFLPWRKDGSQRLSSDERIQCINFEHLKTGTTWTSLNDRGVSKMLSAAGRWAWLAMSKAWPVRRILKAGGISKKELLRELECVEGRQPISSTTRFGHSSIALKKWVSLQKNLAFSNPCHLKTLYNGWEGQVSPGIEKPTACSFLQHDLKHTYQCNSRFIPKCHLEEAQGKANRGETQGVFLSLVQTDIKMHVSLRCVVVHIVCYGRFWDSPPRCISIVPIKY